MEGAAAQADEGLLGQVLVILLDNALCYTPAGGAVRVSVHEATLAGQLHVGLQVQDNGPGIPSSEQERIFERFFRGVVGEKSGTPGTGLGLAIAHEIVERHDGRIEVRSVENEGATFAVWVPATSQPAPASSTSTESNGQA